MASALLARRVIHAFYTRASTNSTREIHSSVAVQRGWLGNLIGGSETSGTAAAPQRTTNKLPEAVVDLAKETVTLSATGDTTVTATATTTTTQTSETKSRRKHKKRRLPSEEKTKRFNDSITFITPRLGRHPQQKLPKIRKATWIRLLGVCQSENDLKQVINMFPGWRDMDNQFDPALSETFIRRCIHLKTPQIALEVFGNYAKYNIPLTLIGARELLNATYDTQPITTVITISSLFDVYKLPPIAQDLPCCAMVISACLKDGSTDAMVVGDALLARLKDILNATEPQPIPKTQEKGDDMPRVWGSWALKKVDRWLLEVKGNREEWLRDWMLRSGYITETGKI